MKEIIEQAIKEIEAMSPREPYDEDVLGGFDECQHRVVQILKRLQGKEEKDAGLWYKISDIEIQYYAQYYVFDGQVVRQAWYASNGEESFWTATITNEIIENVTHVQKMVEPKKPIN